MAEAHAVPGSRAKPPQRMKRIEPWAWTVLVLLLVQNVLGIYLNLFVSLPASHDLAALIASYSALAMHVAVGFLILATTSIVLYLSARAQRASLWAPAAAALVLSLLAFSSGVEFTIGGQDDVFSFLMELLFLGVVASDVLVLHGAGRARSAPGGSPPTRESVQRGE